MSADSELRRVASHGDSNLGGLLSTFARLEALLCCECDRCAGCRNQFSAVCPLGHVPCRCEEDA